MGRTDQEYVSVNTEIPSLLRARIPPRSITKLWRQLSESGRPTQTSTSKFYTGQVNTQGSTKEGVESRDMSMHPSSIKLGPGADGGRATRSGRSVSSSATSRTCKIGSRMLIMLIKAGCQPTPYRIRVCSGYCPSMTYPEVRGPSNACIQRKECCTVTDHKPRYVRMRSCYVQRGQRRVWTPMYKKIYEPSRCRCQ